MVSAKVTEQAVLEGKGRTFEDILDGYFPLEESVRQMMERQGFSRVWLQLLHAPTMDLPRLGPTDPVPVTLPKVYAGMIDYMAIEAVKDDGPPILNGCGDWFWTDPANRTVNLSPSVRLGEPAFVRGVGIASDADQETPFDVRLAILQTDSDILAETAKDLGWATCWVWGTEGGEAAIRAIQSEAGAPPVGVSREAAEELGFRRADNGSRQPMSYLLIDAAPGTAAPEALDILMRIKPST